MSTIVPSSSALNQGSPLSPAAQPDRQIYTTLSRDNGKCTNQRIKGRVGGYEQQMPDLFERFCPNSVKPISVETWEWCIVRYIGAKLGDVTASNFSDN